MGVQAGICRLSKTATWLFIATWNIDQLLVSLLLAILIGFNAQFGTIALWMFFSDDLSFSGSGMHAIVFHPTN